jgi:protein MpaA
VFDYFLESGAKTAPCHKQGITLSCDLPGLNLTQGSSYNLSLRRSFKGQPSGTLFTKAITTTAPVEIVSSSIASDSTVYDKPATLTVKLNKPIRSATGTKLWRITPDGKESPVTITTNLQDNQIAFTFDEALPRSATFRLDIHEIIAHDDGFLPTPYTLTFKTSGGPKVTSVNIGNYGIPVNQRLTLTFDSTISDKQIGSAIFLEISGTVIPATVSQSGNTASITPHASLPRCTSLVLKVTNNLENSYGVAGNSAWQQTFRTVCHTTETIGASVRGRAIVAYRFGSGASRIIYFGGLHGNEQSSKYILDSWMDDLERNYHRIPAHRSIIVIPNVNPDGIAAGSRLNARGVDLNRNFPANDWKQNVTIPGGTLVVNGGGTAPLSEPESAALASYIVSQGPRLVLSYHADAAIVIANDAGDSRSLATTYGQKSRLTATGNSEAGGVFHYDTTGALENWLYDKHSIANLLIELSTSRSYEFTRHQNAMWAMAELP